MDKFIKWGFVVVFLILSALFGFAVLEATNGLVAFLYLIFAYLSFRTQVAVGTKKTE